MISLSFCSVICASRRSHQLDEKSEPFKPSNRKSATLPSASSSRDDPGRIGGRRIPAPPPLQGGGGRRREGKDAGSATGAPLLTCWSRFLLPLS
eukprot:scaffold8841_cov35-Tisochrysis_lutea.AAC.1